MPSQRAAIARHNSIFCLSYTSAAEGTLAPALTHKSNSLLTTLSERREVLRVRAVESLLSHFWLPLLSLGLLISSLLLARSLRTATSSPIVSVAATKSRGAIRLQLCESLSNFLFVQLLINVNSNLVSVIVPVEFVALDHIKTL